MAWHPQTLSAMKADRRRVARQRDNAEQARKRSNDPTQQRELAAYVARRGREIAAQDRLMEARP